MAGHGIGGLLAGLGQRTGQMEAMPGVRAGRDDSRDGAKPFSGFLRTILDAAETANASARRGNADRSTSTRHERNHAESGAEPKTRNWPTSTTEQEREVLERVAILVAEGSLPAAVLEEMTEDSFRELAVWILAGAGGLFPAVADVDASALFASMEDALLGAQKYLSVAARNGLGADTLTPEGAGEWSRLAGLLGLDQLDADAKAAFIETLTDAAGLDGAGLNGAESILDALKGMGTEDMTALLQKAMQAAGLDGDALEAMPELAIRAVLVDVLDEGGTVNVPDPRSILEDLMHGAAHGRFARSAGAEGEGDHTGTGRKGAEGAADGTGLPKQEGATLGEMAVGGTDGAEAEMDAKSPPPASAPDSQALGKPAAGSALDPAAASLHSGEDEAQPLPVENGIDANRLALAPDAPEIAPDARPLPVEPAISTVDMLENIERIEQIMRVATRQNGVQHVSMQLSPPHLGRMSLSVEMRAGVLTATLRTESVEARNMVLAGLEQLRRNLEVQGVQLEGFDVSVDHGEGRNQDAWQHAQDEQQAAFRRRANRVGVPESGAGADAQPTARTERMRGGVMGDGSVNIVA